MMPIVWRVSRPWLAALAVGLVSFIPFLAPIAARAQASDDDLAKVRAVEAARIAAVEKVYHTVVAIYGMNRQGGGSGVIYDPAGYALTNFHVTSGAGITGWAGLADGKLYKWHLVGHDPGGDVAIIKLEGPTPDHQFQFAKLGDSDTVRVGDFAMAMGNPFILAEDQTPTVTLGIVSGVKRYQPGTGPGGKMLEYGNCIQIDSSINPGNSGGPLFNMQGEVIGINGRGSFEERGRVNVGLGYAISINQCKMFIPDLLATKTCEHGTLEAIFARRGDNEVVCESINLDSPLGKAGFDIGDRLLKLDGQTIRTTHEFTNIIATLPAHWPVEVVWEHDKKVKSAWVRLSAISYPQPPARPAPVPRPVPGPAPKEDEKGKAPEKSKVEGDDAAKPQAAEDEKGKEAPKVTPVPPQPGPAPQPTPGPAPQPAPQVLRPAQANMAFGQIRDAKMNEREALRVIAQYQEFMGGREAIDAVKGFRLTAVATNVKGEMEDEYQIIIASDGRRNSQSTKKVDKFIWDGSTLWRNESGKITVTTGDEAKQNATVAMDRFYWGLLSSDPKSHFKRIVLQGTDKAQGQIAYRLLFEDKLGVRTIGWFSVLDASGIAGEFQTRLLKTAPADDKDQPAEIATIRNEFHLMQGVQVHHRGAVVMGIEEMIMGTVEATKIELLRELPADAFVIPQVEEKK